MFVKGKENGNDSVDDRYPALMGRRRPSIHTNLRLISDGQFRTVLSNVSDYEKYRVISKRLLTDRKMALASILLQRRYISQITGLQSSALEISRTKYGKPYFDGLHYNVSHHDGIVVLVGFSDNVGVDIVSRQGSQADFEVAAAVMLSEREMQRALTGKTAADVETMKRINIALKEAYMKFTGKPDWDQVKSIQFLDIEVPQSRTYVSNAVGRIVVDGQERAGYCEYHLVGKHIIAVCTSYAPEGDTTKFAMACGDGNQDFEKDVFDSLEIEQDIDNPTTS